ncbi:MULTISPECIES: hypothetical protein [unclassified Streptomyces]|uniref:hypothetical protein n=1 Tax=unclassified Streptomyces TaxID=2593676 RepID=UPI001BEC9CD5|nr:MULTISPECIES: hypothetical protein [unclassified Streptomyces]MBT2406868.1 hypothetical protein [Streptomyces sp. ISL-21]MBT2612955.1 hypothetical protein [Streptomyces sp. ISL-87]
MTHVLVHPVETARPKSLENRPVRVARARRAGVKALSAVIRYDGIVIIVGTGTLGLHAIVNNDGPLANLTAFEAVVTWLTLIGALYVIDAAANGLIDWINPDRWDGDTAYALAEEVGHIHDDLDSGADPEEIQHSLRTSGLLETTGALTRRLALAFAERGEEDQAQRLYASALHLRTADEVLGHGQAGDEPGAVAREDLQ